MTGGEKDCRWQVNDNIYLSMEKDKPSKAVQIIENHLYWISDTEHPKNLKNSMYFCIDKDLVYQPFYADFGPLSLGKTWKYITELEKLLSQENLKKTHLYHYTSTDSAKCANSAFLMGAFQVVVLKRTAQQAFKPFKHIKFTDFRDASYGECSYKCTILDCLRGLEYAIKLGWFDYKTFNINEYEHYEKVENGDLNWIVPKKFIAFSSPSQNPTDSEGNRTFTPADYVPIFKKFGVTDVVRLNTKTYEASGFTTQGINHIDMYFVDGTCPSMDIVNKFITLAEAQKGVIAVHCKAGLGRTGSLIACYCIKNYQFNAADFIGWIRICRPGSILGPQQHFLIEQEKGLKQRGKTSPIWKEVCLRLDQVEINNQLKKISVKDKDVKMQQHEKNIKLNGDAGQGQRLVNAKLRQKETNNSFNAKKK